MTRAAMDPNYLEDSELEELLNPAAPYLHGNIGSSQTITVPAGVTRSQRVELVRGKFGSSYVGQKIGVSLSLDILGTATANIPVDFAATVQFGTGGFTEEIEVDVRCGTYFTVPGTECRVLVDGAYLEAGGAAFDARIGGLLVANPDPGKNGHATRTFYNGNLVNLAIGPTFDVPKFAMKAAPFSQMVSATAQSLRFFMAGGGATSIAIINYDNSGNAETDFTVPAFARQFNSQNNAGVQTRSGTTFLLSL